MLIKIRQRYLLPTKAVELRSPVAPCGAYDQSAPALDGGAGGLSGNLLLLLMELPLRLWKLGSVGYESWNLWVKLKEE